MQAFGTSEQCLEALALQSVHRKKEKKNLPFVCKNYVVAHLWEYQSKTSNIILG